MTNHGNLQNWTSGVKFNHLRYIIRNNVVTLHMRRILSVHKNHNRYSSNNRVGKPVTHRLRNIGLDIIVY